MQILLFFFIDNKRIATLIRKNSLHPGDEYIVKLKAEALGGLRKGFTSRRFTINEGPYGGRCQALVPRGEFLQSIAGF